MGIGERDFGGAADFLAAMRDPRRGMAKEGEAVSVEEVFERLARLKVATAEKLASQFSEKVEAIGPQIEKLLELGLVESTTKGGETAYALSKVGRRAHKYGRIAQSGA